MALARIARGFDRLAPFYDRLARSWFGRALQQATTHYFTALPEKPTLLVVGGGTGNFLPALAQAHPACKVLYVDVSAKMLEQARATLATISAEQRPAVTFFHCSWDEIPAGLRADAVLTPFFLDCFRAGEVAQIAHKLAGHLSATGVWLLADFNLPPSGWARLRAQAQLWVLYRFFRATTGLKASRLPNVERLLENEGFRPTHTRYLRGQRIVSQVFARA